MLSNRSAHDWDTPDDEVFQPSDYEPCGPDIETWQSEGYQFDEDPDDFLPEAFHI